MYSSLERLYFKSHLLSIYYLLGRQWGTVIDRSWCLLGKPPFQLNDVQHDRPDPWLSL